MNDDFDAVDWIKLMKQNVTMRPISTADIRADQLETDLNNLKRLYQGELQLTHLFNMQMITSEEYKNIYKLLNSGDPENALVALEIIKNKINLL